MTYEDNAGVQRRSRGGSDGVERTHSPVNAGPETHVTGSPNSGAVRKRHRRQARCASSRLRQHGNEAAESRSTTAQVTCFDVDLTFCAVEQYCSCAVNACFI